MTSNFISWAHPFALFAFFFIIFYIIIGLLYHFWNKLKSRNLGRQSFFIQRFLATNSELIPFMNEEEKDLMKITLINTIKNSKSFEDDKKIDNSSSKRKISFKKVVISEENNEYHIAS